MTVGLVAWSGSQVPTLLHGPSSPAAVASATRRQTSGKSSDVGNINHLPEVKPRLVAALSRSISSWSRYGPILRVIVPTALPGFCCSTILRCSNRSSSSGSAVSKNAARSPDRPHSCSSFGHLTQSHGPTRAVAGSATGSRRRDSRTVSCFCSHEGDVGSIAGAVMSSGRLTARWVELRSSVMGVGPALADCKDRGAAVDVAALRMLFIAAIWGLDLRKSSAFTGSFGNVDPEGCPSSEFLARFAGVAGLNGSAGLFSDCTGDCTALVVPMCDSYSH